MDFSRTQSPDYTHRNNEGVQAVPCGGEVFDKSKSYGFQNKLKRKYGCENEVEYFQCFNELRFLVKMNVFKNLQDIGGCNSSVYLFILFRNPVPA